MQSQKQLFTGYRCSPVWFASIHSLFCLNLCVHGTFYLSFFNWQYASFDVYLFLAFIMFWRVSRWYDPHGCIGHWKAVYLSICVSGWCVCLCMCVWLCVSACCFFGGWGGMSNAYIYNIGMRIIAKYLMGCCHACEKCLWQCECNLVNLPPRNCTNYDLCEVCENIYPPVHDPLHVFLKLRKPCPKAGIRHGQRVALLKRTIYLPEVEELMSKEERRKEWVLHWVLGRAAEVFIGKGGGVTA